MADISMCIGSGCPKVLSCYRAQARPNEYRQAYFTEVPVDEQGDCKHYWPMEEAKIIKETQRENHRR